MGDENLSPYSWTKSKNVELIKNYSKWFGLKYETHIFTMYMDQDKLKIQKWQQ